LRLSVIAVGRLKPGPEKLLAEEYLTRAQGLGKKLGIQRIGVTEFAESPASSADARMAEEARLIAGALPERGFSVVLDERGKTMTSEAFSTLMKRHLEGGTPEMSFVIGGPDGHSPATRSEAGLLLSLGAMTWPHRLVRVLLFEQIYRAITLMAGHPYHRA
jgi:23S rRNA (pseudouridine1915-N3)-methyltransferase